MLEHFLRFISAGLWFLFASGAFAQTLTVTFLHTPPTRAIEGKPLEIYGVIVGADQVSIAAIAYRHAGSQEYEVAELKMDTGDRYRGKIPASAVKPPAVEYYCYAVDFEGNQHLIFASAAQPQTVPVVSREEITVQAGAKKTKKPEKEKIGVEEKQSDFVPPPGNRSEIINKYLPIKEERVPRAITIIDRQEIERAGYRTLAEILDTVEGITVSRTVNGNYQMAVRGLLSPPAVLVLWDGKPLANPLSGHTLLEFPAAAIEKVEVLRGPASGLYGSGAVAAVVLVDTIKDHRLRVEGSSGSYFDSRLATSGGLKYGKLELSGQLFLAYTSGYERLVERDIFSGVGSDDPARDVSNTPGHTDDWHTQVFTQLDGNLADLPGRLSWQVRYFFQERGPLVGKLNSLDSGSVIDQHWMDTAIDYRWPVGAKLVLESHAWFDLRMESENYRIINVDEQRAKYVVHIGDKTLELNEGMNEIYDYTIYQTGGKVGTVWEIAEGNFLTTHALLEYLLVDKFTETRSIGSLACPADGLLFQGYLLPCGQYRHPAQGKERLLTALQLADDWQNLLETGVDLHAAFRLDWASDYGLALAPQLALGFWPWSQLGLKTSYGMSYRAPTLYELYGDNVFDPAGTVGGNSKLEPTVAHQWEAGLVSLWSTSLARTRIDLDFFMNWIEDNIIGLNTGQGMPSFSNSESLNGLGLEVALDMAFGRRSHIRANLSWFRVKSKLPGRPTVSYITDVPQLRFNLEGQLELTSWLDLTLELRSGCERRNNVRLPLETLHGFTLPAWTTLAAGLTTAPILFDSFSFFVQARNLLQQDMRDPHPRPDLLPGMVPREPLVIFAGIRWQQKSSEHKRE